MKHREFLKGAVPIAFENVELATSAPGDAAVRSSEGCLQVTAPVEGRC